MKRATATTAFVLAMQAFALHAQDLSSLIDETFLRATFPFAEGETLKFSKCEEKTVFTCTYVWGVPADADAIRESHGLPPKGTRIMVMYAETNGMADWPRVTRTTPDGTDIGNLGQAAMWSATRGQLSVMSAENLLFHVNVGDFPREAAVSVATHILEGL